MAKLQPDGFVVSSNLFFDNYANDTQCGCRPKRGCAFASHLSLTFHRWVRQRHLRGFELFVDVWSAFDRVIRSLVMGPASEKRALLTFVSCCSCLRIARSHCWLTLMLMALPSPKRVFPTTSPL